MKQVESSEDVSITILHEDNYKQVVKFLKANNRENSSPFSHRFTVQQQFLSVTFFIYKAQLIMRNGKSENRKPIMGFHHGTLQSIDDCFLLRHFFPSYWVNLAPIARRHSHVSCNLDDFQLEKSVFDQTFAKLRSRIILWRLMARSRI